VSTFVSGINTVLSTPPQGLSTKSVRGRALTSPPISLPVVTQLVTQPPADEWTGMAVGHDPVIGL
jgi:hypothetical protein